MLIRGDAFDRSVRRFVAARLGPRARRPPADASVVQARGVIRLGLWHARDPEERSSLPALFRLHGNWCEQNQ
jgi:hypothetical protein